MDKIGGLIESFGSRVEVSQSDGFHVHVAARQIATKEQLVAAWLLYERLLFLMFPAHRRASEYCERLDGRCQKSKLVASIFEDAVELSDDHYITSRT